MAGGIVIVVGRSTAVSSVEEGQCSVFGFAGQVSYISFQLQYSPVTLIPHPLSSIQTVGSLLSCVLIGR